MTSALFSVTTACP